jgi:hypothetical protein
MTVAAETGLLEDGHADKPYNSIGPDAISWNDLAALASERHAPDRRQSATSTALGIQRSARVGGGPTTSQP